MATIAKLNIEKATVRQLFRVVVKATDEIIEASLSMDKISVAVKWTS